MIKLPKTLEKKYARAKFDQFLDSAYKKGETKIITKDKIYPILREYKPAGFGSEIYICNDLGNEFNYWASEFELFSEVGYKDYVEELILNSVF